MEIILYDTEFTAWEGSLQRKWSEPWEARELIQFSAKKIKFHAQQIEEISEMNLFVQPNQNPILSDYIQKLTGITQTQVDAGSTPQEWRNDLAEFTESGRLPLFSWGNDYPVLAETIELNQLEPIDWIQSYDLRSVFEPYIDTQVHTSGQLYRALGLQGELRDHNAADDVLSLFISLEHLYQKDGFHILQKFNELLERQP